VLAVAALLHDVGYFIGASGHHKHGQYILAASPVTGLDDQARSLAANVVRYHRKAAPSPSHEPYRALSSDDRDQVTRLAALLRLADALDMEHEAKVTKVQVKVADRHVLLRLEGEGDLLLERWAIGRKCGLFEVAFGVKVLVE
jgi:exopolyphosphatase/guanosine-5'-triphosphate,3'-diphosphate pyrophosphatase